MNQAMLSILDGIKFNAPTHARRIFDIQLANQPELDEMYDERQRRLSIEDIEYHLQFLAEAMMVGKPELYGDYMAWTRVVLESRNVPTKYLKSNIKIIDHYIDQEGLLSGDFDKRIFFDAALRALEVPYQEPPAHIDFDANHGQLAKSYLELVLGGFRKAAIQLIMDAVEGGIPIKDVLLEVLQPVQHEIGRLWQVNEISVAKEHYCTAIAQQVIAMLYPRMFDVPSNGLKMIGASVDAELHEMGIRMVTDFFEMEGWETTYLGARTPVQSIIAMVEEEKPDVVALSATMMDHVTTIKRTIAGIREVVGRDTKVIVGGYPFNVVPGLWQELDADGYSNSATGAVELGRKLVGR
ncbi:cobalamin-binding protein [Candidatus Bathyarchaeota archaeon]|nr:cobalamin-binding protein [Candidatus Bathyarchaeota archaeon]